jgi:hypothetical protein
MERRRRARTPFKGVAQAAAAFNAQTVLESAGVAKTIVHYGRGALAEVPRTATRRADGTASSRHVELVGADIASCEVHDRGPIRMRG